MEKPIEKPQQSLGNKKKCSGNRQKEFGCFVCFFYMGKRTEGALNKKDYHKEKKGQLFSISMEEQIIGNGLRLQHNGGYEYESIS